MIIKFGYYDDEDFGLTAFPEIKFSELEIEKNKKKNRYLEKKKKEYTKYLITGIMEDFPDTKIIDILLPKLKQIESGELRETTWICEEYPLWSCKFEEYKKVLESWKKFLRMEFDLKSEIMVEI